MTSTSRRNKSKANGDLFPEPASVNTATPPRRLAAAKKPRTARGAKAASAAGQAFLPGLSRRGRPRLKNPPAPSARAAASRRKRLNAGARRIELMLDAEAAAMLDALAEHLRESRVEVVSRLIARAARRILG